MITKEKYIEIKQYVHFRLSCENDFMMSPQDFCNGFGIKAPYYEELKKYVSQDNCPFLTEGHCFDKNGDPSDPIRFYRKQ
jgi:hypothetical protein